MTRHSWILLAVVLAITCAADTPAARAGLVTPDSIGSPVLSSSVEGSVVAVGGLVTNQYQGLGLLFPAVGLGDPNTSYSTAIIQLNNHDVFTGAYQMKAFGDLANHISYRESQGVTADLVLPGTTTSGVADSATVSLYANGPVFAQLEAFDKNGQLLKTILTQVAGKSDTPIEFDVAGIQSINTQVFQPVIDPPYPGFVMPQGYPYAWGVASIEWHEAPEPAGFILGGVGMFALLGYSWRRRSMRVRLGVRGA
jgi:hypothetical protein